MGRVRQVAAALGAALNSLAGLTTTADQMLRTLDADVFEAFDVSAAGFALLEAADAAAQSVALDLELGVDAQAWHASLDDIAGIAHGDGAFLVSDGNNWTAESGATARTSLGLAVGSDVQAYHAALASLAGLTTAADKMVYTTAADTYAVTGLAQSAREFCAYRRHAAKAGATGRTTDTITDDPHLTVSLGVTAKYYHFKAVLFLDSDSATPDAELGVTMSSGLVFWSRTDPGGDGAKLEKADTLTVDLAAATPVMVILEGTIYASNATFAIRWAQATADATATTIGALSTLEVVPVFA